MPYRAFSPEDSSSITDSSDQVFHKLETDVQQIVQTNQYLSLDDKSLLRDSIKENLMLRQPFFTEPEPFQFSQYTHVYREVGREPILR